MLENVFAAGEVFQNITCLSEHVFNERKVYTLSCNKCQTWKQATVGVIYNSPKCVKCGETLFILDKPNKMKVFTPFLQGDFTISGRDGYKYVGTCKNGTKCVRQNLTSFTECFCKKCKPNRGFSRNAASSQYSRILKEGCDGTLTTYEEFENVLSRKTNDCRCMVKIDASLPWGINNIKFVRSSTSHDPVNRFREMLEQITEHHRFVSLDGDNVLCECVYCGKVVKKSKSHIRICFENGESLQKHNCNPTGNKGERDAAKVRRQQQILAALSELNTWAADKYNVLTSPSRFGEKFSIVCMSCGTSSEATLGTYRTVLSCGCYPRYGSTSERFAKNQAKFDAKWGVGKLTLLEFTSVDNPVTIRCEECGVEKTYKDMFSVTSRKYPCSCQALHTPDPNEPCKIYYVKVTSKKYGVFYKIGITTRTVRKRFAKAEESVEPLRVWHVDTVTEALELESKVLEQFSQYRLDGKTVLAGNGGTECFTKDVLRLDKK